jgi:hypothetical protein
MGTLPTMDLQHKTSRAGFKIVCTDCGNLSIKVAPKASDSPDTIIECRRCNAVRGTLGDLQDLARRGRDSFEF